MNQSWLRDRLANANPTVFSAYCIIAAFGTYFCMYAFRKPFTAATYDDQVWLGIGFKTILVASQVTGYTLSKFLGIKVVSEMPAKYRAISILGLIAVAEVALFLFAVTPVPWNFVWLFVNGLPLGMVFGLVLGFLEGRRVTESLSAGLCARLYRGLRVREIGRPKPDSGFRCGALLDAIHDRFDIRCPPVDLRVDVVTNPAALGGRRVAAIQAGNHERPTTTGLFSTTLDRSDGAARYLCSFDRRSKYSR